MPKIPTLVPKLSPGWHRTERKTIRSKVQRTSPSL